MRSPTSVFMAFGTKGDVDPLAAIAAAFASDQEQYQVVLITYSAHEVRQSYLFLLTKGKLPRNIVLLTSFEREFGKKHPDLYNHLQEAPTDKEPVTGLPTFHERRPSPSQQQTPCSPVSGV